MITHDFQKQVKGYGLTTANILYRRPDHPWLLQSYVWQNYDLCPDFPELQSFLEFWQKSLEGVLHSVTVAHSLLIKPAEIKPVDGIFSCIDRRLASLGRLDRLFSYADAGVGQNEDVLLEIESLPSSHLVARC